MGAPQSFGRYELVSIAGSGGMAQVHLARQVGPEGFIKPCVLKRIAAQHTNDPEIRRMFLEEARISALLNHPNIVQTFDFGEVEGAPYLAMELVDGVNLAQLCRALAREERWLPLQPAVEIIGAVLDALDYAHNLTDLQHTPLRLVHRDVSPQNTLVSRAGTVKLGDFGIAHHQAREAETVGHQVKGKPAYMAPEQAMHGAIDGRTDLFAVGVMLTELISARRVLTADDRLNRLLNIEGHVRRLCGLRHDCPPELIELAVQLCALKPEQRPSSAREAAQRLRSASARVSRSVGVQDFLRSVFDAYLPNVGLAANPMPPIQARPAAASLPAPPEATASDLRFSQSAWSKGDAQPTGAAAVYEAGWPSDYLGAPATDATLKDAAQADATDIQLVSHSSSVDAMQYFQAQVADDLHPPGSATTPSNTRRQPYVPGRAAAAQPDATQTSSLPPPEFTPSAPAESKGLLGFEDPKLKSALSNIADDPQSKSDKPFSLPPVVPLLIGGIAVVGVAIGILALVSGGDKAAAPKAATVGTVEVSSDPPGAAIFIDGRATGKTTPAIIGNLPVEQPLKLAVTRRSHRSTPPDVVVRIPQLSLRTTARFTLLPGRAYRIVTTPADATVSLNGHRLGGLTPLSLPVVPFGETATLTISLDEHLPHKLILRSAVDTATVVKAELQEGRSIEISSTPPGATVQLDGKPLGTTPIYEVLVPKSRPFYVKIRHRGFRSWRKRFVAKRLKEDRVIAELKPLPFLALPWSKDEKGPARDMDRTFTKLTRQLAAAKRSLQLAQSRQDKAEASINASVGDLAEVQRRTDMAQETVAELEQNLLDLESQMDGMREQLLMRPEAP